MLALVADNESEEKELIKIERGSSALIIGYAEENMGSGLKGKFFGCL